jgi:transcriptional regulator with XRE-family HTH domain
MGAEKSLPDEEGAHVRRAAQDVVDGAFGGRIGEAAKAMGVSPPYLSQILNGKAGAGFKLLRGLSQVTGVSEADLRLGKTSNRLPAPSEVAGMGAMITKRPASLLEGWEEAVSQARAENPTVPAWAWDEAALLAAPEGAQATPTLVADLAFLAWRHTSVERRQQLEASALEAAMRARHARLFVDRYPLPSPVVGPPRHGRTDPVVGHLCPGP